jgi:perosamine synthetase
MTQEVIPYGRQWVDEADLNAVFEVLRSAWLTTGPKVAEFEEAVAAFVGAPFAVAVSSGTAALHAAMFAAGIGPGDEVIVPPLTFVATANAVVYLGATPVFADVDPDTLLLDPKAAAARITPRTRAIIGVDYAGQPCDYDALGALARSYNLFLVADACHSLGAEDRGIKVGALADLTVFSFHPVKHITTGEGGMVVTPHADLAAAMRRFRNHGLDTDHRQRSRRGTWHYEMLDLGYNYRLSDFQCALGLSQLRKLPDFLARRRAIARRYDQAFAVGVPFNPVKVRDYVLSAYHLYPVLLHLDALSKDRPAVFQDLRARGIGANVHYFPVHLQPYYHRRFHTRPGDCPVAEGAYERLLTLPLYPAMSAAEVDRVIDASLKVMQ